MGFLRDIWRRFRGEKADPLQQEIDEEMRFHIERRIEEYVAGGLSPDEAEKKAMQRFGDYERHREQSRFIKRYRGMGVPLHLARQAGLALITAILFFTWFKLSTGTLLPGTDSHRNLSEFHAVNGDAGWEGNYLSVPDYLDIRKGVEGIENFALFEQGTVNYQGLSVGSQVDVTRSTPNFFEVLDTGPFMGRLFRDSDRPGRQAIISYDFWVGKLGRNPLVIGSIAELDGMPAEVIGIVRQQSVSLTGAQVFTLLDTAYYSAHRNWRAFRGVLIKEAGAGFPELNNRLEQFSTGLADAYPETNRYIRYSVRPMGVSAGSGGETGADYILLLAFLSALLVSMIALLARQFGTWKEMTDRIRYAFSPSERDRLSLPANYLIPVWISLGFAVLAGMVCSGPLSEYLYARFDPGSLGVNPVHSGSRVLGTGGALLLMGMAAAYHLVKHRISGGWKRSVRLGGTLLSAGVAVWFSLLLVSSMEEYNRLSRVDVGFDSGGLYSYRVVLNDSLYLKASERQGLADHISAELAQMESVLSYTHNGRLLLSDRENRSHYSFESPELGPLPDGQFRTADVTPVAGNYFDVLGIPVRRGSPFAAMRDGVHSAVINETMARTYWHDSDPVGSEVIIGGNPENRFVISAVTADTRNHGLAAPASAEIYIHHMPEDFYLTLRFSGEAARSEVERDIRRMLYDFNPGIPPSTLMSLERYYASQFYPFYYRIFARLVIVLLSLGFVTCNVVHVTHYFPGRGKRYRYTYI